MQNGFKDWVKLDKARHAVRLGKKHWQKLDAFSRHNRINDDNMEVLNWHLINVERGTDKLQSEIEILNLNLKQAREEKTALETLLVERNHDVEQLKEMLDLHQNKLCNKKKSLNFHRPFEMDAEAMQLELKAVKRKMREREREHRAILIKVLEEVENELQEKDYKLAVTEAKMIQVQIQYEQERKSKEKIISETIKKVNGSQVCSVEPMVEQHESCTKSTATDACVKMDNLSELITRAMDDMMERENHHEKQLNDLIDQAAKVSRAGCQLRTVKNLLHTAEEKIESFVECSESQNFQEETDISDPDACVLNKEHDVDKRISDVLHTNDSLETQNLGNKHHADYIKLQEEQGISDDCENDTEMNCISAGNHVLMLRNDTRNNSLSTKNRFLIRRSNGLSKGKAIISGQSSTLIKMEQSRDEGHSERKCQGQVSQNSSQECNLSQSNCHFS